MPNKKNVGRFFQGIDLAVICSLLFCSIVHPTKPEKTDPSYTGMKRIDAANRCFSQGADDAAARSDEKPVFSAGFSYNFWLDTTEVTQQEYADITGKRPVPDTGGFGVGDRYPVYNVSWFDAALFCNAKSKRDSLDTVYSYYGAPLAQNGSVYEIAGVQIHYDRNGFRLPTESEWEFAAREGPSRKPSYGLEDSALARSYAWFSANSLGTTHPVAQRFPNTFGLYDMAGNVYEWTGDWKGPYSASSILNSIGAQIPNHDIEKVIKGGSFENGFASLRLSRRATTYPTSPSTAAEYLGFRCARGTIVAPAFISGDTSRTLTNPAVLTVTSMRPFTGASDARVVFVNVTGNMRTLCFVDFNKAYPVIQEVKDLSDVYAPTISPNGKYVAFCTRNDGSSGQSISYVRTLDSLSVPPIRLASDSAFIPRWWVDPILKDTFLIYTNSAIDNSSALWTGTQTFLVKMAGPKSVGAPVALAAGGSYHDGRSWSGHSIVTSNRKLIVRDLSGRKDVQLFMYPNNGKDANSSTQVCNASISPDSQYPDRCLFEDFGAPGGSTLVGKAYGAHEYLFIADFSGNVNAWYKCPDEERTWDYPEWSNNMRFAIACGANNSDEPHAVYVVDLSGAKYYKIVEGQVIENPFLWINSAHLPETGIVDLDSLGYYDDPPVIYNLTHFAKRMLEFWRVHASMEIVFLGTSHTAYGVDPHCFSRQVYNMAFSGCFMGPALSIINNYALIHCQALKLIACDIIPGNMNSLDYYGEWNALTPNKGYNYDKNHQFWREGLPANFEKYMALVPCPDLPNIDTLGLERAPCMNWGGSAPEIVNSQLWTFNDSENYKAYRINFQKIKDLAQTLANRKIHFLLYITPENPRYGFTDSYCLDGPNRATGEVIVSQLKALQDSIPGYFHFYDANLEGNHDYADSEAYDCDHLCPLGARKLSVRLDSLVHTILNP
jgi:uncharacterized protein (TIGR02171 family)